MKIPKKIIPHLKDLEHALERECLRIDQKGRISQTPHPKELGDPLLNPYITLDFSEAQIEMITPVFDTPTKAFNFLRDLHSFTYKHLPKDELLWPFSMPAILPAKDKDIPIADFGISPIGQEKNTYRKNLAKSYGPRMQTISGTHYNFSLGPKFLKALDRDPSEIYFHIARNLLRHHWLNIHLFGAAPTYHKSFRKQSQTPFAVSYRTSEYGYMGRIQSQKYVNFNSISEYEASIQKLINQKIIQAPAEFYSVIRPKMRDGKVAYLELRALDLNPFCAIGINTKQICFLKNLLLYCLFTPSPPLSPAEYQSILKEQNKVSLQGRDRKLKLQEKAAPIIREIKKIGRYACDQCFHDCQAKSAACIAKEDFLKLGISLAHQHKKSLSNLPANSQLEEAARLSQINSEMFLPGYEDMEGSTQLVMKEALKRGVEVEVLDRGENFIRLKKGRKIEYIKQANKTRLDSYMAYLIMENKLVSKVVLREVGLRVPEEYSHLDYPKFQDKAVVVKPTSTNFGIGISIVPKKSPEIFTKAVQEAHAHSKTIVVEEFIEGKEYRFLVIGEKVYVIHRDPANVVGDGKHTIRQLVKIKNEIPENFKNSTGYIIRTGKEETKMLADQKLTWSTVLPRNKKIYLHHTSNLHNGGDPIDFTDQMPARFKKIALQAARAVPAEICGIDMIIPKDMRSYAIIEINFNPALQMHNFPFQGQNRQTEKAVLDLLGF
ncbi:bifunctional glutamate--cysteine ligase GshA/glutathione synthetase GshB [Patescibacteria group bacterium]|nr:bifunctional glutamate--cysteine ligase GshA/glutathione synthetase GshB [Patescibacteria group bacterium]